MYWLYTLETDVEQSRPTTINVDFKQYAGAAEVTHDCGIGLIKLANEVKETHCVSLRWLECRPTARQMRWLPGRLGLPVARISFD